MVYKSCGFSDFKIYRYLEIIFIYSSRYHKGLHLFCKRKIQAENYDYFCLIFVEIMKKNIKEEQEENSEFNREPSDSESVKRVVVVPGETIVSGEDYLPGEGTRRINEDVVASRYGLAEIAGRVIKVISLFGAFIPRRGNVVIGRVSDITFRGWNVDIDSASAGFLPIEESPRFINKDKMDQFLAIGEV